VPSSPVATVAQIGMVPASVSGNRSGTGTGTGSPKTVVVSSDLLSVVAPPLARAGLAVVACPHPACWPAGRGTRSKGDLLIWDPFSAGTGVLEACRKVRQQVRGPILVLTSHNRMEDTVAVFEAGMDGYLALPPHADELVARVRALLRRAAWGGEVASACFRIGSLEIDVARHEVRHRGSPIPLTPREFALLLDLFRHPGQVLNREQLLDRVWGLRAPYQRTVDVHILRLRAQLRAAGVSEPSILTVRGIGYCLATGEHGLAAPSGHVMEAPMQWPWLRRSAAWPVSPAGRPARRLPGPAAAASSAAS
jgi:DNA-binding response OmpR family regulator